MYSSFYLRYSKNNVQTGALRGGAEEYLGPVLGHLHLGLNLESIK